ncbi:MAG: inosine/xanthosine triphosphatase [Anditalea sp.]
MAFPKRKNLQEKRRQHLVITGSRNPVKIKCIEEAFHMTFEKSFMVQGLNVGSGVGKQPLGDTETYTGAYNRASNSKIAFPEADYWVGIEGGTEEIGEDLTTYAWIVIMDKNGKVGQAKTATFFLPKVISNLVKGGMELGEADDQVFNRVNSKQGNGAVGILTNGTVNRKDLYKQAVILGLIPFINGDMY